MTDKKRISVELDEMDQQFLEEAEKRTGLTISDIVRMGIVRVAADSPKISYLREIEDYLFQKMGHFIEHDQELNDPDDPEKDEKVRELKHALIAGKLTEEEIDEAIESGYLLHSSDTQASGLDARRDWPGLLDAAEELFGGNHVAGWHMEILLKRHDPELVPGWPSDPPGEVDWTMDVIFRNYVIA